MAKYSLELKMKVVGEYLSGNIGIRPQKRQVQNSTRLSGPTLGGHSIFKLAFCI